MKINKTDFLKSCYKETQFPNYLYPEFAFLGRSNVGKSSLINMLLNQKRLVKTGSKPGVTVAVNFFLVNDHLSFVDLPGYGYAKLPLDIKKKFLPLIKSYLETRDNLKLAFLLIDARREPDQTEHEIIKTLLDNEISLAITLTKCDKLSNNELKKNTLKIADKLGVDQQAIFYTSSAQKKGRKELLSLIQEYTTK